MYKVLVGQDNDPRGFLIYKEELDIADLALAQAMANHYCRQDHEDSSKINIKLIAIVTLDGEDEFGLSIMKGPESVLSFHFAGQTFIKEKSNV